jgi:isopentenyl diphosphate isomerase/L-lactate dehydrogenase-like FMN-dependent dehydrogenase
MSLIVTPSHPQVIFPRVARTGATACTTRDGMAKPMLEAAKVSAAAVVQELEAVIAELKAAMLLTGSSTLAELQQQRCIVNGPTADWIETGE